MFNLPCNLDHVTELFRSLCDASMDLDPKSLDGKIPENILERAQLAVLADVSVVRACANVAERLSNVQPYQIEVLMVAHHKMIAHYLFIRRMILDGVPKDDDHDFDLRSF